MSDFLRRLAQRSLGLAPTLEVWTPGLFGTVDVPEAVGDDDALTSTAVPSGPTQFESTVPSTNAGPLLPRTATARAPEDAAAFLETRSSIRLDSSSVDIEPLVVQSTPPRPGAEPLVPTPSSTARASIMSSLDPTPAANSTTSVAGTQAPAFEPLLPREPQPRVEWQARPPVSAAVEPVSTIRVSIGRVEVRAVASAAKRPELSPASSTDASHLSLSEYLRQSSGAGR